MCKNWANEKTVRGYNSGAREWQKGIVMQITLATSAARGIFQPCRPACKLIAAILLANTLLFVKAVMPPVVHAQTTAPEGDGKPFDLSSDPDFRNYQRVVRKFAHKHRPDAENDFCISGFYTRDNLKSAWVIWRQGRQIILWEGQPDLDHSRRSLHLATDVVATEEDLHGSTYRVTHAWVEKITAVCEQSGVKVHVSKLKGSPQRSPQEEVSK